MQQFDFFYNYRPHIYFALAFFSLVVSHNSSLMDISGVVLLLSGIYVANLRHSARQNRQQSRHARGMSRTIRRA